MQLTHKSARHIALALTQASAMLLGQAAHAAVESTATDVTPVNFQTLTERGWLVDSAVLMYQEADSRVQAVEPTVRVQKDFGDQRVLNAKLTIDSLTGASPNGATSANVAQTFTGPSGGEAGKTTAANQLPLDDEFKDTRVALSAGWQQPISADTKLSVGGNLSSEYDFRSIGANVSLARDYNEHNTTLSAGAAFEFDQIDPVGGAPAPLSPMGDQDKGGSDSKTVTDLLFGMTQVLNRHALLQLNYSLSLANGYQSDPYKLLTAVDPNGNLITDPDGDGSKVYLFEHRPDSRTRHSLYAELKYGFDRGDVSDVSYRFTTDDWGIDSHTIDAKYRYQLNDQYFVEPHLRYYTQTAADFYHSYLLQGREFNINGDDIVPAVKDASADSRLGAFDATTVGLKFGMNLSQDRELSLRVEQYDQTAKEVKPIGGNLAGQILQPDLSATIVQLGYTFKW